jgi:hypothetical protein
MAREIVVTLVLLAGDSQPLRTILLNKCSKLFFFPRPLLLAFLRLLQWRLLLHALTPRSTEWETASTAYELQMAAALMLTALQPPISSLPFGTRLLVTNPANNRSVTVTVTDRGPFIAGRSLDLSYGAFSRIASPGQGVARVCFAKL